MRSGEHAHCRYSRGAGAGSGGVSPDYVAPASLDHSCCVPPGAQNQTLQRLQQVLHADSGPCLPHLLSRLCQDLGPGAFRLAARMYLQKGRCWWQGAL